jgi:hypothetical protein
MVGGVSCAEQQRGYISTMTFHTQKAAHRSRLKMFNSYVRGITLKSTTKSDKHSTLLTGLKKAGMICTWIFVKEAVACRAKSRDRYL